MYIPEMRYDEMMTLWGIMWEDHQSVCAPQHPDSAHNFLQLSPAPQNKKHN